MESGERISMPAMAAGFASLLGQIAKGAGDTVNVPEGMINIGGNGRGYLLQAVANWNPLTNNDGTFSSLSLGDDICIYAAQSATGVSDLIASKNTTFPDGYTADNTRKIGGFHVGRVRPFSERYNASYVPAVGIVPNSVWDLHHRPVCDPSGFAEMPDGRWISIYQLSEGSGTGAGVVPVSRYGATPIKDDIYARKDFPNLLQNAGMYAPDVQLFRCYAQGAPQGSDTNNDTAWSATSNSGPTTTGAVAKAVSQFNIVDAVGNLWDYLSTEYNTGTAWNWDRSVVNTGIDASHPRGEVYHDNWRSALGGGRFDHGARDGAECVNWINFPWNSSGSVGVRGVSDPLPRGA
mgnify:CR=1 FL=1